MIGLSCVLYHTNHKILHLETQIRIFLLCVKNQVPNLGVHWEFQGTFKNTLIHQHSGVQGSLFLGTKGKNKREFLDC